MIEDLAPYEERLRALIARADALTPADGFPEACRDAASALDAAIAEASLVLVQGVPEEAAESALAAIQGILDGMDTCLATADLGVTDLLPEELGTPPPNYGKIALVVGGVGLGGYLLWRLLK